ncbi:MAG: hypothetical protein NTW49_10980 [Bacteroidia bacterium]|nr:hypothetical protein [Bacteroidia bacterium]
MKKTTSLLLMILFVVLISGRLLAQKESKPFEGYVTMGISMEGANLSEAQKAQVPKEATITIKGNLVKTENKTMFYDEISISDCDKQTLLEIINVESAGMKKYIKMSKEDVEKGFTSLPTYDVKEVNETKEIAGYTCKKAEITDEEGNVNIIYYSADINVANSNWDNPIMKNIKGFPLEYSQPAGGNTTIKYVAKDVKKKKVKDSEFAVPDGYTEMTKEEAAQMMGGGM